LRFFNERQHLLGRLLDEFCGFHTYTYTSRGATSRSATSRSVPGSGWRDIPYREHQQGA
jgi:hypothetical protein